MEQKILYLTESEIEKLCQEDFKIMTMTSASGGYVGRERKLHISKHDNLIYNTSRPRQAEGTLFLVILLDNDTQFSTGGYRSNYGCPPDSLMRLPWLQKELREKTTIYPKIIDSIKQLGGSRNCLFYIPYQVDRHLQSLYWGRVRGRLSQIKKGQSQLSLIKKGQSKKKSTIVIPELSMGGGGGIGRAQSKQQQQKQLVRHIISGGLKSDLLTQLGSLMGEPYIPGDSKMLDVRHKKVIRQKQILQQLESRVSKNFFTYIRDLLQKGRSVRQRIMDNSRIDNQAASLVEYMIDTLVNGAQLSVDAYNLAYPQSRLTGKKKELINKMFTDLTEGSI